MSRKILCTAYPSSRKVVLGSKNAEEYVIFSWEELCDRFGFDYDEDMKAADRETSQDLKDKYNLNLLGYAVKKENLHLLDPDTDPDTQEAITPFYVEDEDGNKFTCGYSRGVLRNNETGEFIR